MAQHITTDKAYEIDLNWQNADVDAADTLPRLVSHKNATLLTIPSLNGSAPTYQYRGHDPATGAYAPAYYHTAGPTLDEWYKARQAAFNAAQAPALSSPTNASASSYMASPQQSRRPHFSHAFSTIC